MGIIRLLLLLAAIYFAYRYFWPKAKNSLTKTNGATADPPTQGALLRCARCNTWFPPATDTPDPQQAAPLCPTCSEQKT